jgi:DNA-binding beta-propeller fold protein YncE
MTTAKPKHRQPARWSNRRHFVLRRRTVTLTTILFVLLAVAYGAWAVSSAPSRPASADRQARSPTTIPPSRAKPDLRGDPSGLRAGSDPSALPGPILVADRGNNRLIEVDPQGHVIWEFPRTGDLAAGETFRVPDDAFFTPDGKQIVATQEDDFVVTLIDIATHKIVWRYGTPGTSGAGANQLWNPDDAIMLRDGHIIVSDIKNCRVLLLTPGTQTPLQQLGRTGHCSHRPGTRFSSPNGAFPQNGGRFLVTEIGGDWITSMGLDGVVSWSTHAPGVAYPSDTNQIGPDRYLTVDYSQPGKIVEFDHTGRLVWQYAPTGADRLDKPSLAEPLPNGDILATDDDNNRVIVVDPTTNKIVWQYGHTGIAGQQAGYLSDPDGADVAPPYSLVTHA